MHDVGKALYSSGASLAYLKNSMQGTGRAMAGGASTLVAGASAPAAAVRVRGLLLVLPLLFYLAVLYALPVANMMLRSVTEPHWTLGNFAELLHEPIYAKVLWITLRISLVVTVAVLLLGYPVAYLMARLPPARSNLLMILVLLPFWSSILVRSYAWMVLLGRNGIINQLLLWSGVIDMPLRLLNTTFAVYIAMVHVLLPFMILPLYATLRAIDPSLLRAGASLGARPAAVFRQIVLPLSLPGVSAGSLLVFILALGFYITPALVGGPRDLMMAMLIQQEIDHFDWPLGSALAVVLLAVALGTFAVFTRVLRVEQTFGRTRA
jgi:putative spermidine/putrescine transport system permease protein